MFSGWSLFNSVQRISQLTFRKWHSPSNPNKCVCRLIIVVDNKLFGCEEHLFDTELIGCNRKQTLVNGNCFTRLNNFK